MVAKPCTKARHSEINTATNNANHGEPVKCATLAEAKHAASILPSKPISTTPERSLNKPAMAAKTRGVDRRIVASKVNKIVIHMSFKVVTSLMSAPPVLVPANVLRLVYTYIQGHHRKELLGPA